MCPTNLQTSNMCTFGSQVTHAREDTSKVTKVVNALFWPTRCAREQEQSLPHMSVWIKDIPISPSPNHPTAVIWITTSNHKHPLFHSLSSSPSSFPSIPATLLGNLQTLRLLSMHPTCSSDCGSGCPLPWWTGAGDVCWRQLYNGRDLSFRDYQGLLEILEPAPANGIVLPFCYHCCQTCWPQKM